MQGQQSPLPQPFPVRPMAGHLTLNQETLVRPQHRELRKVNADDTCYAGLLFTTSVTLQTSQGGTPYASAIYTNVPATHGGSGAITPKTVTVSSDTTLHAKWQFTGGYDDPSTGAVQGVYTNKIA